MLNVPVTPIVNVLFVPFPFVNAPPERMVRLLTDAFADNVIDIPVQITAESVAVGAVAAAAPPHAATDQLDAVAQVPDALA